MAEVKPTDKERWIMFGDGCLAAFLSVRPLVQEGSPEQVEFKIRPTAQTRWKHSIKESDYDDRTNHAITKKFDKKRCKLIDPDPDFQKWFIWGYDIRGNRLNPFDEINRETLTTAEALDNEVTGLKSALLRLELELEKERTNKERAMSDTVSLLKKLKPVMGTTQETTSKIESPQMEQ